MMSSNWIEPSSWNWWDEIRFSSVRVCGLKVEC